MLLIHNVYIYYLYYEVKLHYVKISFDTPSAAIFEELGWLPINKRLKYNKAVFTYKALNSLTPQYITDLLKPVSETHSRALRSSVNEWRISFSKVTFFLIR